MITRLIGIAIMTVSGWCLWRAVRALLAEHRARNV